MKKCQKQACRILEANFAFLQSTGISPFCFLKKHSNFSECVEGTRFEVALHSVSHEYSTTFRKPMVWYPFAEQLVFLEGNWVAFKWRVQEMFLWSGYAARQHGFARKGYFGKRNAVFEAGVSVWRRLHLLKVMQCYIASKDSRMLHTLAEPCIRCRNVLWNSIALLVNSCAVWFSSLLLRSLQTRSWHF